MPEKSKSTGPIPTTVYPIRGRWMHDHPAATHIVPTKAAADELVASGAFTDDPNHGDRDTAAPDLTGETPESVETPAEDQSAAQPADSQPDAETTEG